MSPVFISLSTPSEKVKELPRHSHWTDKMKVVLPVDTTNLPGFQQFVNANGFRPASHPGFDFIAYQKTDGKLVIGLPNGTPTVAIMDGVVLEIVDPGKSYFAEIFVAHALLEETVLLAVYKHAKPDPGLKTFSTIRQGDVIGHLADSDDTYLDGEYHLHIDLVRTEIHWNMDEPYLDKRFAFHTDPQPILFPNTTIPNARIDYPEIKLCDKPTPPNWPTRFLTMHNAMRFW